MSTLRRTIPLLERTFRTTCLKSFHTTSGRLAAAKKPQRRGRVASTSRIPNDSSKTRIRHSFNPEDCLPPSVLLHSAQKAGALEMEPEKALELLLEYQNLAGNSAPTGWEQNLCTEYDIQPGTLAMLGRILNRCSSTGQRLLGKRLMISASELGDSAATFEIIESAIRSKSLGAQEDLVVPLQRLGIQAKQEKNPEAMALLGKVLLTQGKEDEALQWLRKATSHSHDISAAVALNFGGASEALVSQGRILLGRKDRVGAEKAFRKAALELDDPAAYFYLSQLEESGSSKQEIYLLKAATSGITEASHNLGTLELAKLDSKLGKDKSGVRSIEDYGLAREWFQVAAAAGFGLSMLNMASICKSVGQEDVALQWLERAETLPEVREKVESMRKLWASEGIYPKPPNPRVF